MYADLGPGQTIELEPHTAGGAELLYGHAYVARRMRSSNKRAWPTLSETTNLYGYVSGNPMIYVDPTGRLKVKIGGYVFYVHENDPDPFPSRPHAHMNSPNSPYKVNINDGEIFNGATPTGKKISRKVLDSLRQHLRGKGLLCIGFAALLVVPEAVQAGQAQGAMGVANVGGQFVVDAAVGTASSAAVGTVITSGAAVAGTSVTVGGAAATGVVASTGVGAAVLLVGGVSYAAGTYIGQTEVGGTSVHGHIGNAMYWACPWCFE